MKLQMHKSAHKTTLTLLGLGLVSCLMPGTASLAAQDNLPGFPEPLRAEEGVTIKSSRNAPTQDLLNMNIKHKSSYSGDVDRRQQQ